MSTFSFSLPFGESVAEVFGDIPTAAKNRFAQGFALLTRVQESQLDMFVNRAMQKVAGEPLSPESEFAKDVGLSPEEAEKALVATALLTAVSTQPSVEEAIKGLENAGFATPEQAKRLVPLVNRFRERGSDVKRTLQVARVAARILPSYKSLGADIDVRLSFDEPSVAVPVVVCSLVTDVDHEMLRFQMTAADVRGVLKKLEQVAERLEVAEQWARTWRAR